MTARYRVVTPYRPFAPESDAHLRLGPFDWVGAVQMLRESVRRSCQVETRVITDVDTAVDALGPAFQYVTESRRLMLWILEVALCYLGGPDFDRDTVMISPDALVFCDLSPWFASRRVGIIVRPRHKARPILNGLQWWPIAARETLIELYQQAYAMARTLDDETQRWGADTVPLVTLLKPLYPGCGPRRSGIVANLIDSYAVMTPLTSRMIEALEQGKRLDPPNKVLDFKYTRKLYMRQYFERTIGQVPA